MGTSRRVLLTRNRSALAGIDKNITSPIKLGGTVYTPAELKAAFQAHIDVLVTVESQRKTLADTVSTAAAVGKSVLTLHHLLRAGLISQNGKNANAVFNEFGMTAPKPPGPSTVEGKLAGNAKRAATRAARHTMGSKQKKRADFDEPFDGLGVVELAAVA